MWAELFCLSSYLPDSGRGHRSEARELASDLVRQAAPPLPRFPPVRVAPPPPPRTCVVAVAPPGGRRRASRRSNSVCTLRGWTEPARGEFPAPNWPLGPPPVPHPGFLGHWEAQKSVECIGAARGLGWASKKRLAVRLQTAGLQYISAASNSAVVPKVT
jgi:hypothetical protein